MRVRLYVGFIRGETWYNYAEVGELVGGALKALDTPHKSTARIFANITRQSVTGFYDETGVEKLTPDDTLFKNLPFVDTIKVCMENMKIVMEEDEPIIKENFFCTICDRGARHPTVVEESWIKLIKEGMMDEFFAEKKDELKWKVELPRGIELPQRDKGRNFKGGTFKTLTVRHITTEEQLDCTVNPKFDTEAKQAAAGWDREIQGIEGIEERDFNILLRRNSDVPFTFQYMTHKQDQDMMANSKPKIGIDGSERMIKCRYCQGPLNGGVDITNFFSYLSPEKPNQKAKTE